MNESQDTRYRIQFSIDDVVDKVKEIHALEEDERNGALIALHHELRGPLISIADSGNSFNSDNILKGEIPNIHQRAYVSNISALSFLAAEYFESLLHFSEMSKMTRHNDAIYLMKALNNVADFLPAIPKVLELGNVSDKRLTSLGRIDANSELMIYSFNALFSKNFKRDKYNLGRDIDVLWGNYHTYKRGKEWIGCCKPLVVDIETKVDYFINAIIPLIYNVYDHAFNPSNNVNKRILEKSWEKQYQIKMKADEEKKEIVVEVTDTGFGVSQEVLPRLFERGASSKTDKTTDHGIGLWSVKKFIEDNGGRIWVETNLGQGTSFYFTIPYKEKDRVYRQ